MTATFFLFASSLNISIYGSEPKYIKDMIILKSFVEDIKLQVYLFYSFYFITMFFLYFILNFDR